MRHKITPEVHGQITAMAQTLPIMAHTDKNGQIRYRPKEEVKRYTGAEYIAEQKERLEKLKRELKGNLVTRLWKRFSLWRESRKPIIVQGKPIDPEQVYEHRWRMPMIVNHLAEMVAIYKTKGQEGVDEYVKKVTGKAESDLQVKTNKPQ